MRDLYRKPYLIFMFYFSRESLQEAAEDGACTDCPTADTEAAFSAELRLLQLDAPRLQEEKPKIDCVPSGESDDLNLLLQIEKMKNETLKAELRRQGRITDGYPDWTFVHIPKTGGDSFTMASLPLYPEGMGHANAHVRERGTYANCWVEQLPPKLVPAVVGADAARVYENKTVFCAVRHPYRRAISSACHALVSSSREHITPAMVSDNIRQTLTVWSRVDPFYETCFWIPQVEYTEGPLGCSRVINFDHLSQEYEELMAEAGYPLELPAATATHTCKPPCKVEPEELDKDVVELLSSSYARDFERWGRSFGWEQ